MMVVWFMWQGSLTELVGIPIEIEELLAGDGAWILAVITEVRGVGLLLTTNVNKRVRLALNIKGCRVL